MNELIDYINDSENAYVNFKLAQWYEDRGYTAPGISFYLRAAERSEDNTLAYHALLRGFFCYNKQGSRDDSAKIFLENAISFLPKRPEAYFLLIEFYINRQQWQNAYIYACIVIECCCLNSDSILSDKEYPGDYIFYIQKAIAGWHWGKTTECRELLWYVVDKYLPILNNTYKQLVEDTIARIGAGPNSQNAVYYTNKDYNKLKFKFPGSNLIINNYSQAYQDMFVLYMLNGKQNGTFLEIGSSKPFERNNTALLEQQFHWTGIGIEKKSEDVKEYNLQRPSTKIIESDALNIDYNQILSENYQNNTIDYLQLDIEPPGNTYECLLKIPFDKYKFAIITYEHDDYIDITKSYREKSRKFLEYHGYKLIVNDISVDGVSNFEDWWVHPELVSQDRILSIMNTNVDTKKIDHFFLNNNNFNFYSCRNSAPTAIIVDNFYDNPDSVRNFALSQEFLDGGFGLGYIGKRTANQYLFEGLKERFESILGQKIQNWENQHMNGRFQITYAGQPLVYHCDSQKWAGMIYLTPEAPFECGTTLYAHKKTRARSYNDVGWDYSWKNTDLGDLHLDGTFFEPVDVLGNVYNRLVIFDGSNIHSASKYFGQIDSNARLWHMFFFD